MVKIAFLLGFDFLECAAQWKPHPGIQRVQQVMERQQFPKCCTPRVDARPRLAHALGLWRALEAEVSQGVGGGQGVRGGR